MHNVRKCQRGEGVGRMDACEIFRAGHTCEAEFDMTWVEFKFKKAAGISSPSNFYIYESAVDYICLAGSRCFFFFFLFLFNRESVPNLNSEFFNDSQGLESKVRLLYDTTLVCHQKPAGPSRDDIFRDAATWKSVRRSRGAKAWNATQDVGCYPRHSTQESLSGQDHQDRCLSDSPITRTTKMKMR
jgi:hypothetical protein